MGPFNVNVFCKTPFFLSLQTPLSPFPCHTTFFSFSPPTLFFRAMSSLFSSSNYWAPSSSSCIVNFLVDSVGLSRESAIAASSHLGNLKTPEKPLSVINFLKSSGFNETHIHDFIRIRPQVLKCSVEKTLKPRFELLQSLGLSGPELASFLSSSPFILCYSMDKHLKPSILFLRSYFNTNKEFLSAIQHCKRYKMVVLGNIMKPNLEFLESCGIARPTLQKFMLSRPGFFYQSTERLKQIEERVRELGCDPKSKMFVYAMYAMSSLSEKKWKAKLELLESFGFSKGEVFTMFSKAPYLMSRSEERLMKVMDYFLNELKYDKSFLASRPVLFCYSLEKRVIPRFNVLQALRSSALLTRDVNLSNVCFISEESFLQKYVFSFGEQEEYLLNIFKGNRENDEIDAMAKASSSSPLSLPLTGDEVNLMSPSNSSLSPPCNSKEMALSSASLRVKQLIDSVDLSEEAAISISHQFLHFKSPKRPLFVLKFLKNSGFHDTLISNIVTKVPQILTTTTLKSKFKLLQDLGLSGSDLGIFLSSNPAFITCSTKKHLEPSMLFLKSILKTNEDILSVLKRHSQLVMANPKKALLPNIRSLLSYGVGASQLEEFMLAKPASFTQEPKWFKEILGKIKKLGLDCQSNVFSLAVLCMCSLSKDTWQSKLKTFESFGWSEENVLSVFIRNPLLLEMSEKKLQKVIYGFINILNFDKDYLVLHPSLLCFDFEGRVLPRHKVLQALKSKNLVKKDIGLSGICGLTEEKFLQYLLGFGDEADFLLRIYNASKENTRISGEMGG
ncbi:hypothetical protein AMTRI_Chr04g189440 [Amborella trichopoda]